MTKRKRRHPNDHARHEARLAEIRQDVATRVERAHTVADMWRAYADAALAPHGITPDDPEIGEAHELIRHAFYAGAAGMLDLMMRVAPDEVSEERGAEMLQRLSEELTTHARGLA